MLSLLKRNTLTLQWLGKQLFNRDDPAAFFDPLLTSVDPMLARQYVPARVEAIHDETADTRTFVVRPAPRWTGFTAGQHVTIHVEIDGRRYNRTFSLSSSPLQWQQDGSVNLTIKRLPGGLVTNWLHDNLSVGDVIGLGEAFGSFCLPEQPQPVLFIAGGSGITPILSQLETMASRNWHAPVSLLYCVRTSADIIAAERLYALRQRWPAFSLTIITTAEGPAPEFLNDNHLEAIPGVRARLCYLCGPTGLMDLARDLLHRRGIGADHIHSTFFSAPRAITSDEALGGDVRFDLSDLTVASTGDAALLEIAEAAKLSPKYGCRMGICHQCSCTKTSGTVFNRLTGKTSGPGEEKIQLCVTVPRGPVTLEL